MVNELKLNSKQKIDSLSKGNKAKVKFIIALSRECPVLCLDEPLAGLDPIVREEILQLLISYVDLTRQTVILSTHEVAEVEPFLDRVILLKAGGCELDTDVEALRTEKGQSVLEAMQEVIK
ncbi:AAA family ATPase [Salisediminibacterium halotolerans]|uniref:AAA family ATPase n=1 Tax=Salisediminibacterium halotolerans TaxID=517425 RepID=UPI000EAF2C2E|nr:AAA family ATPase [Salisediminibacterium halotolerans]